MVLYRNSRSWRLRLLCLGFWFMAAAFLAAAIFVWAAGQDPGDGALTFAILGLVVAGMAAPLDLFRRRYVVSIRQEGQGLVVETLGLLRPVQRRLPAEALNHLRERQYLARGATSTAVMLRAPGARIPFVVDTTEDALEIPRRRA